MAPLPDRPPLISCLMATRPSQARLDYLSASLEAYARQSWPNRELVIVHNGGSAADAEGLARLVHGLSRNDIRLLQVPDGLTLGQVRNASMEAAQGSVFCQWDDDDLSHPERLTEQWACLSEHEAEAVYLQDVMQYFPAVGRLFWTHWAKTEARAHPGTLMLRREAAQAYPEHGPDARLGEDLVVARALWARGRVAVVEQKPWLFLYVSHGQNSWHEGHHAMLADRLSISRGLLARRELVLRENLEVFALPAATTVWGQNGAAFVLGEARSPSA